MIYAEISSWKTLTIFPLIYYSYSAPVACPTYFFKLHNSWFSTKWPHEFLRRRQETLGFEAFALDSYIILYTRAVFTCRAWKADSNSARSLGCPDQVGVWFYQVTRTLLWNEGVNKDCAIQQKTELLIRSSWACMQPWNPQYAEKEAVGPVC